VGPWSAAVARVVFVGGCQALISLVSVGLVWWFPPLYFHAGSSVVGLEPRGVLLYGVRRPSFGAFPRGPLFSLGVSVGDILPLSVGRALWWPRCGLGVLYWRLPCCLCWPFLPGAVPFDSR